MDARRRQDLWALAIENLQAASLTAQQGWYNVSVACSYYAVFTAMWVALGDPPRGKWEHGGIFRHFAWGYWQDPPAPLERPLTKAIRRAFNDRVKAHYKGVRLTRDESADNVITARQTLHRVAITFSLPQGGIPP
ncbi:MAG: hypothetical protein M3361_07850 [Candidatus Tectomicrobia bacterium]|nr:hypothetical protein [Candidatus Tectomicrobia bacterium]